MQKFLEGGVYKVSNQPGVFGSFLSRRTDWLLQSQQADDDGVKITPVYAFDDSRHFASLHHAGTLKELELDCKEVNDYNKKAHVFDAWALAAIPGATSGEEETETFIVSVNAPEHVQAYLPKEGGRCSMKLVDAATKKDISVLWSAERIANPFGAVNNGRLSLDSHAMFKLTVPFPRDEDGENKGVMQPLLDRGQPIRGVSGLVLGKHNRVTISFHFVTSEITAQAELAALEKLVRAEPEHVKPSQLMAFDYIMDFKSPAEMVSLFDIYPGMEDPDQQAAIIKPAILDRYRRFNAHQKRTYQELLSGLPAGVGFVPGGPGAGKTSWALTVIGVLQSVSRAKVLYVLDINQPLDDTIRKYVAMWKKAGTTKKAIRVRGFGSELKNSGRFDSMKKQAKRSKGGSVDQDDAAEAAAARFMAEFLALYRSRGGADARHGGDGLEMPVPWTKPPGLTTKRTRVSTRASRRLSRLPMTAAPWDNRGLKDRIFSLYQDVIREADFIATTPVVAATYFSKMYKPDLIFLDEAAHARELSTLIPIANFNAKAILQIGDFRQTLPYVRDVKENRYAPQLLVSPWSARSVRGLSTTSSS